jgi:hypothetical protein
MDLIFGKIFDLFFDGHRAVPYLNCQNLGQIDPSLAT